MPTRVLRSLWHHKLPMLVITALVALAPYVASLLQPEVYRSESRIFLTNPAGTFSDESARSSIDPEIHTLQQVPRVTAAPVLHDASQRLNGRWSADELESMVTVAPQAEALILLVGANAPTPQASTDIVVAVTQAYGQFNQSTAAERAQPVIDAVQQSQQ